MKKLLINTALKIVTACLVAATTVAVKRHIDNMWYNKHRL